MIISYVKEYECNFCTKHKVFVKDSVSSKQNIECSLCKQIIYTSSDLLCSYNIALLGDAQAYKNITYPFIYIGFSNTIINDKVHFFEKNYPNTFSGYKLHPQLSIRSLNEIYKIDSNKPLIVHTEKTPYDNPNIIIKFSKRYPGNIFYRLNEEALDEIAFSDNLWIFVLTT